MFTVLRTRRMRSRDATFSLFKLSPFGRRRSRFGKAKAVRKPIAIVHPHTYSDEPDGRDHPVIVNTKMEALGDRKLDVIPDLVLSAGTDAARVRRELQNSRGSSDRATHRENTSLIPITLFTPPSVMDAKNVPQTPTDSCITLSSTIPDVLPPTFSSTEALRPVRNRRPRSSLRRPQALAAKERRRKPIFRHFVFIWKRVTGFARRVVHVGPDGHSKSRRQSWLPAGFVLIDPRSSWWKKQSTTRSSNKYI